MTPSIRTSLALALGCLLASVAAPFSVRATTLRYRTIEQLAQEADVVVWGDVRRVGTRMQRAAGGRVSPTREAHINVREVLQGRAGEAVAVHLEGGSHRQGERRVHGEAGLREGEEVVLFLRRVGDRHLVLGMGLGVLRVDRPVNGNPRLVRQLDDAVLVDANGRVLPAVDENLSIEALRRAISRAQPTRTGNGP